MRYSVYGINYEAALSLIKKLKDSGIDANITQGGIAIVAENLNEINTMKKICEKYGTVAKEGATPLEEDIIMGAHKGHLTSLEPRDR